MRTTLALTLILLVAAFAVAQDTTSPSAPAGSSQTQSQRPTPGAPDQAAPQSQSSSPSQAAPSTMPAMGSDVVEGCLGGSQPNYTVTDSKGITYQLLIPQGADASPLAKHIGESVKVQGSLDNSASSSNSGAAPDSAAGSSASPSGSAAAPSSAAGAHSIHAMRIGKGTTTCPGSSSTTPKPPSK